VCLKLLVVGTFVAIHDPGLPRILAAGPPEVVQFPHGHRLLPADSQVVWEHYLALLFIPLAFLVAAWHRLDRGAHRHIAAILALCVLQNLVLVLLFRDHVPVRSHLMLLAVSLIKAGPLLAFWGFLWFRRSSIFLVSRSLVQA
jgi:hypothetical protein